MHGDTAVMAPMQSGLGQGYPMVFPNTYQGSTSPEYASYVNTAALPVQKPRPKSAAMVALEKKR